MKTAWSSDFTYRYFKNILQTLRADFRFHLFAEAPQVLKTYGQRAIFLRHDIDIDLNKALKMAKIENGLGICATYMVMPRCTLYNINDQHSKAILSELIAMGHEIGLHFDFMENAPDADFANSLVESKINADIKQLEGVINQEVRSISFHRPLAGFLKGPLILSGLVNAYSKELMAWYLSDSAGKWREGAPLPKFKDPTGKLLQLLIHPIWWNEEHKPATEVLEDYFNNTTRGWLPERIRAFDTALANQLGIRRSGFKHSLNVNHNPESGPFNTDSDALKHRIESHEKFGSNDLNDWIFEHLDPVKGASILDLGCGTGKQTIPLAQVIGNTGLVVSFDASQQALDSLLLMAKQSGTDRRIIVKCNSFEDLDKEIEGKYFDRVVASFSLYYAQNPDLLFQVVHRQLKQEGIFFFCGPSKSNNAALKSFHNSLVKEPLTMHNRSAVFMEETGQLLATEFFNKVEIFEFQNPLRFSSAEALYKYWSSYNLYNKDIDAEFKEAAEKHFKTHSVFETVKHVIGVKATK